MALSFTTPEPAPRHRTQIDLDGETLWAIEPKAGLLLQLGDYKTEGETIQGFLDLCMEPDSAKRLRERMYDPEDNFDLDTLTTIIRALQGEWAGRRPTKRSASSRRRSPTSVTSMRTSPSPAESTPET